MRRLSWWCCVQILIFCLPAYAGDKTEVIVYADESYPPYSFIEKGQLVGIYPEIFRKAFARLPHYQVLIRPIAWKRGLLLLETGYGFALFPPYRRVQERPYMSYSESVLTELTSVFCRRSIAENKKRMHWPEDFFGLKIAVNTGFATGGAYFEEAVREGKIVKDEGPGNRSNILKLMLGRVDCYINDRLSILWELQRLQVAAQGQTKVDEIVEVMALSQEPAYLGFTNVHAENYTFKDDFVRELNSVLLGMQKQGEIQLIVNRYMTP